ncbi:hypothetical protein FNV43_RR22123 [Rhamnella rubrinervis]|uniref:CHHC U11-48K-type domain-containing protein n=1 Tax=Rhamnella rubrinervis TaxID=2594499 RepID=A0A8K0DQY4_9ROSA|nr:hypothetical protein FNV43_RR22123 [Rhamnella rubrinervis]
MSRPPAQFSNLPFAFQPLNTNPLPNLFNSQPQNPQPQNLTPFSPPELSTTLSSLESLIHCSQQTLHSLSTLFPLQNSKFNDSNGLIACPFNSHHLMHPEHLSAHTFRCPSSPYRPHRDSLPPLNYLKTLKSSDQCPAESTFLQAPQGCDAELCFSLDDYYANFGSNFFYHECPAVVNLSVLDGANRTFTLPAILSVQCANFAHYGDRKMMDFEREHAKILPSEFWAIKAEVAAWNEYPGVYSHHTLYAILGLDTIRECNIARWVISKSPRYGVVIDVAMRDHIVLLFSLCLKAIRMEALTLSSNPKSEMISNCMKFNCPILVQSLMWLASQFSILYGEMNGKLFSINILKQCILDAALGLLIFPLEQKEIANPSLEEVPSGLDTNDINIIGAKTRELLEKNTNGEQNTMEDESVTGRVIFVSQAAAAIAALHERSLLEGKIKGLSISQPHASYQVVAEYDYMSQKANEERKNRPQYRRIIEHDGLPRQRSCSQDTGRTKTREEFLAEYRDFKRRRMTYRGKKGRQETLEVMRNIIEGYMDEIKQAGGIGCFEKRIDEGAFPSEPHFASDFTMDVDRPTKSGYGSSAAGSGPNQFKKQLHSDYSIQSASLKQPLGKDYEEPRKALHGDRDFQEDQRGVSRHKRDREYYSRSPEKRQSHDRSHEQTRYLNDSDVIGTKHKWQSSSFSKHHDNRSASSVSSAHQSSKFKDRDTYKNYSSKSLPRNTFEDRYDPSKSHGNLCEDEVSTNGNYIVPD